MSHLPDDRYVAPTSRRQLMAQRYGFGRFAGYTLLGTILPGSGLLLAERRKSGGLILAGFVALVLAATAYFWYMGTIEGALMLVLDPSVLLWLAIGCVILGLIWLISVVWTAIATWPSRPQTLKRFFAALLTAVLSLVLIAPMGLAASYLVIQRDLLGSVFQAVGSRTGIAPRMGSADPWSAYDRVNILLVGSDAEDDRQGTRTDSMMLASVDTHTGDTVLFGLPRNLENAPFPAGSPMSQVFPQGYNCGDKCLLNEVWGEGEKHADLYPGDPKPGLTALTESVSEMTGLNPDYSVVVDMSSFQALVNAMGGVDINVQTRVPIGGKVQNGQIVPGSISGWIEPGPQHLDGYHAMWYSRGRATSDDFDRMRRQRCMVGAIVDQVNPGTMLQRYPALAQVVKDSLYTNIPQQHLPAFADLVTRMQSGHIRSLTFSNKVIDVTDPDFDLMRQRVQEALAPPAPKSTPEPTSTPTPQPSSARRTAPATPAPATSSPPASEGEDVVSVTQAC